MKKYSKFIVLLLMVFLVTSCNQEVSSEVNAEEPLEESSKIEEAVNTNEESQQSTDDSDESDTPAVHFIDDMGEEFILEEYPEKVISMYSVHTENIYSLGAQDKLIGVSTSVKYPEEATRLPQYSYRDDPEPVIAADPDVVIIRTMIARRYGDYVKALKDAGIPVVTLYCSEFSTFDHYIERLAQIMGAEEASKDLLANFHSEIERIQREVKAYDPKNVYFESIGDKFKTATPNSFAGKALEILGTNNIASDVVYDGTTTVVEYGQEPLLSKGEQIDFYIAQEGVMNRGVTVESIIKRPGYDAIKAVQTADVYVIEGKRISGATLRYLEGLKELAEVIYE